MRLEDIRQANVLAALERAVIAVRAVGRLIRSLAGSPVDLAGMQGLGVTLFTARSDRGFVHARASPV